jgi:hypothetical protein
MAHSPPKMPAPSDYVPPPNRVAEPRAFQELQGLSRPLSVFRPPPLRADPVAQGAIGNLQFSSDFALGNPGRVEPFELFDGLRRDEPRRHGLFLRGHDESKINAGIHGLGLLGWLHSLNPLKKAQAWILSSPRRCHEAGTASISRNALRGLEEFVRTRRPFSRHRPGGQDGSDGVLNCRAASTNAPPYEPMAITAASTDCISQSYDQGPTNCQSPPETSHLAHSPYPCYSNASVRAAIRAMLKVAI